MNSDPFRWLAIAAVVLPFSCALGEQRVLHPVFPDGGLLKDSVPVPAESLATLAGTWTVAGATKRFGPVVAASSTSDTWSLFAARNNAYAVLRAGCLDNGTKLVFEGYWRYANDTDTGLVRLFAGPAEAASKLCAGQPPDSPPVIEGSLGEEDALPDKGLAFTYRGPLLDEPGRPFQVVAHRGGCRTSDDCGASENSVEVLQIAQSLGASAVEVDVRLTSDGVPILYHDEDFNARLVQGQYCHGAVEDFSFPHVQALCTLRFGEPIPTLDQALTTVREKTSLHGIWLDVKTPSAIAPTAELVQRHSELATAQDRKLSIVIGLGEQEVFDAFMSAGLAGKVACLAELEPSDVRSASCRVFAPRWTRGPMAETVAQLQAEGRAVAFWTLDEADFVDMFLREAKPNALLTNRPGLVFHRYQMIGTPPPAGAKL